MMPFVQRAMRRAFCGAWVLGAENLPGEGNGRPLLACASHTNWWDGFAAALVSDKLAGGYRFSVMQEARHLAKYPFFRKAGVFGIDLEGSALSGIREALRRLEDPQALVWIFPQGRFCRADEPVVLKPGVRLLAARSGALLLPVWFHYLWMFESRPALVAQVGRALDPDAADGLSAALEALRVSEASRDAASTGEPLLPHAMSLNKIWELWARRLRLVRPNHPFDAWNR